MTLKCIYFTSACLTVLQNSTRKAQCQFEHYLQMFMCVCFLADLHVYIQAGLITRCFLKLEASARKETVFGSSFEIFSKRNIK